MIEKISDMIRSYLSQYPHESEKLSLLREQIERESWDSIISRKNFTGHITASAFVIDISKGKCLMIDHVNLGRILQPGGHVDMEDLSLMDSARREVEEETGIMNILPFLDHDGTPILIDIDTHAIPANPRKEEPAHFHHDFRYLFTGSDTGLIPNAREVKSVIWIDIQDIDSVLQTEHLTNKIFSYLR